MPLEAGQAGQDNCLFGDLGPLQTPNPGQLGEEFDIALNRAPRQQRRILKYIAEVPVAHANLTRRGRTQA